MRNAERKHLIDELARVLFYPYGAVMHGLKWKGLGNVPARGPAILAANHQSFLDPLFISAPLRRRPVFIAWQYYYHKPVLGTLMRLGEAVPIDTDEPGPRALERMLRALGAGRLCGIFPEGGRTPDGLVQPPKPGVALLALRSGAPVVPVTVHGAFAAWPVGQMLPAPGRISVCFGRPVRYRAENGPAAERDVRARVAAQIMLRVADGFGELGRPDLARRNRRRLREAAR